MQHYTSRLREIAAFTSKLAKARDPEYLRGLSNAAKTVIVVGSRGYNKKFDEDPDIRAARADVEKFMRSGLASPGATEKDVVGALLMMNLFYSVFKPNES